jgi:hypothetical protein
MKPRTLSLFGMKGVLDPLNRVADVTLEVRERPRFPLWPLSRLRLELVGELPVVEGEHPAAGVVNQHDLLGT